MPWNDSVTLLVEFGFGSGPLAAAPTFTDVAAYGRGMTINRGRSSVRSTFDAGTLTVLLSNNDGRFDPNNTAGPHYPNLKLGTPVRIRATYNAVTYTLFRGAVTKWPLAYPARGNDAVVMVEATDNMAVLNTTLLSASYGVQDSDDRITAILDSAGWQAALRDLDAGVAPVAAVTYAGTSALEAIRQTVEAEAGEFFISADGDATFNNRVALTGLSSTATFGPTGAELDYEDVTLAYDDDLLVNEATVTAGDDTSASKSDATSITDHGQRSVTVSNDLLPSVAYAADVAAWLVGRFKDVKVRVTGLTISPHSSPTDLWPEVLNRELRTLLTVKVDPPGSGTNLNQVVGLEGISHDITPDLWQTTYICHPLSTFDTTAYWILGTSLLNTTTVLA